MPKLPLKVCPDNRLSPLLESHYKRSSQGAAPGHGERPSSRLPVEAKPILEELGHKALYGLSARFPTLGLDGGRRHGSLSAAGLRAGSGRLMLHA